MRKIAGHGYYPENYGKSGVFVVITTEGELIGQITKIFQTIKILKRVKKKSLWKTDPKAFDLLLDFSVTIEDNLHYSEKQEYIELAKDFLTDQITADDFSYNFIAIYGGISKKLSQMKQDESLELANFLKSNSTKLGDLLARIYGSCDSFSLDTEVDIAMSDEKELKDCAQILLLKLQEE